MEFCQMLFLDKCKPCALILFKISALYKSFTYLLTYLLTYKYYQSEQDFLEGWSNHPLIAVVARQYFFPSRIHTV